MFDKPKHFDQQASRTTRFMRKKTVRVLWYVMLLLIAALQLIMFLRSRRQNLPLFHSTLEMVLVVALLAVALLGVLVKGGQNRRR
ncbi:MAG TPA: hypothetical protein VGS27_23370 [Candidatus Sulfotelmatobacter sp.]|nr:hypothetical protein [Candidatus Sulfotelmatobacter sp.]HEV2468321.1 hypothetical protein [Candidatus Sulfotelmatobacter sp.]